MIGFEVIALSPYAREMLAEIASRRTMKRFRDAAGRLIDVREVQPEDWTSLAALNESFEVTTHGPNLVALCGDRVVGHAALVASAGATSNEIIVFVHPDYRNGGIDSILRDELLRLWDPGQRWRALLETSARVVKSAARALRLVMIPLVCAVVIAAVSEDPRGRALGLILAIVAVVFGLAVEARSILLGEERGRDGG